MMVLTWAGGGRWEVGGGRWEGGGGWERGERWDGVGVGAVRTVCSRRCRSAHGPVAGVRVEELDDRVLALALVIQHERNPPGDGKGCEHRHDLQHHQQDVAAAAPPLAILCVRVGQRGEREREA